jgi:hypothetical protein
MEHYLSKSKILMKTKEGEYFYTNEMSGDEGTEGLSFILGYGAVSREKMGRSGHRRLKIE